MRDQNAYAPFAHFVAPAALRPAMWRVALVTFGFEFSFLLTLPLFAALSPSVGGMTAFVTGVTPLATVLEFAAFCVPCAALFALVLLIHARGPRSLLGHGLRHGFGKALLAVSFVLALQEILSLWTEWNDFAVLRDALPWALWLLPAFAAILLQVATEELFFRGYLQQQLAVWSSRRRVWMWVPALTFGLVHYANGATMVDGVLWAYWATLIGLACADLTARTGNLGAAIGLHLAINLFSVAIVSIQDAPGSGLALLLYPPQDPWVYGDAPVAMLDPWVAVDLVLSTLSVFVMWMAARLALRA